MNNTIQLYIDKDKEIKGYPITSPDRVIDENGVSIKQQLEQIKTNTGISVNTKNEILKEKKENILREKLGILSQVEIMKQSELLRNTVELTNLKQSENNYIGSINNLINIIDTLLEGGENNG